MNLGGTSERGENRRSPCLHSVTVVDEKLSATKVDSLAQHIFHDVSSISEEEWGSPFMEADWYELVQIQFFSDQR